MENNFAGDKEALGQNDENPGSPFIDVEGISSDDEEPSIALSSASQKGAYAVIIKIKTFIQHSIYYRC